MTRPESGHEVASCYRKEPLKVVRTWCSVEVVEQKEILITVIFRPDGLYSVRPSVTEIMK